MPRNHLTRRAANPAIALSPPSFRFWLNENSSQQAAALVCLSSFTNLPERSRPSDQTHQTAELRRCAVRRSPAWASETVLPSAPGLAEPCLLDGPVVLRAPVYRRCIAF